MVRNGKQNYFGNTNGKEKADLKDRIAEIFGWG